MGTKRRIFKVEKVNTRAFRWTYQLAGNRVSNSLTQQGARECKANMQDVVFWMTQKMLALDGEDHKMELLARGGRQRWLLVVPFLRGWAWRLHDGRKVFFQPELACGFDDAIDALFHFQDLRDWFGRVDAKETRRAMTP